MKQGNYSSALKKGKSFLWFQICWKLNLLDGAPARVRDLLYGFANSCFEKIRLSPEDTMLAEQYIENGVVGKTSIEDCYHIAMATTHNVDVLASWNFKQIVNLKRIQVYNSVNIKNGYNLLEIRNSKDLIDYE